MSTPPLSVLHRTVLLVAGFVIIAAGMYAMASTVNLVLVSMLLALTITPIPDWLGRRGMKRGHAVLLTVLGVLVGGVLLLWILSASLSGISAKLPAYQASLNTTIEGLQRTLESRGLLPDTGMKPDTERVIAFARTLLRASISALGYSFLILILVILLLIEMPYSQKPGAGSSRLAERVHDVASSVRRFVGLTGQIGAVQGALNLVAMLAVGTDFPVVWAVLFFLLNFVPFGFLVALIPPVVVTLLEKGPQAAGILFGIQFVINLLVDNVVKPKVMGGGLGLSPVMIVISLLFWSTVLGPVGAILAVPLAITISRILPYFTEESRPA